MFPALEAVLESAATLEELSDDLIWLFFMSSAVEMLTRSQRNQVQAQFHTCVSTKRSSWHTIAATVIYYVYLWKHLTSHIRWGLHSAMPMYAA